MRSLFKRPNGRTDVLYSAVLAVLMLAAALPAWAQPERIGAVRQVLGEVVAERDGSRRALAAGSPIAADDEIVTGQQAKVEILFYDGSTVAAGPNTRFAIAEYDPGERGSGVLKLITGILRTSLSGVWRSGFAVHTRAAIASVRSTHWITIAEPERASVFVISGGVAVQAVATGEEIILASGFGIDVAIGGGLPAPRQWPIERVGSVLAPTFLP